MLWITILSVISSIVTIVSFLFSLRTVPKRVYIALLFAVLCILSILSASLSYNLMKVRDIERAANELVKDYEARNNTARGFIQAGLAFMETHKNLYPDSYERAKKVYSAIENEDYYFEVEKRAEEMKGLLLGISVLNRNYD